MKNDSLFSSAISAEKLRAEQLGRADQFSDGENAFALAQKARVPRSLAEVTLQEGDTFAVPADEKSKQWLASPLQKDGDPRLRLLAEVTDEKGAVRYVHVFLGSLLKSVTTIDGKNVLADVKLKDGTSFRSLTAGFANADECWRALFGKTLKVTNSTTCQRKARTADGAPIVKETIVLNFEEV